MLLVMGDTDVTDGNCMARLQIKSDGDGSDEDSFDQFDGVGSDVASGPTALMSASKYSLYYKMNHKRRGIVYIFNHQKFTASSRCQERHGTDEDVKKLHNCFRHLEFDVHHFKDLKLSEIEQQIAMVVNTDHTNHDCLIVVVLSHGNQDILHAKDTDYDAHGVIFDQFTADKCPSLAGKPKLFFIQACQGERVDSGITLVDRRFTRTETDGLRKSYRIPTLADFLIMYATSREQYAFRNNVNGSYFITVLCDELKSRAYKDNLLTILTIVIQRVAVEFVSNNSIRVNYHNKKQTPYFQSSLTRLVKFSEPDTI